MINQSGETRLGVRRPTPRVLLLLVILLLIIVASIYYFVLRGEDEGVPKPDTVVDQQEAADNALGIMQDLAKDNYTLLGFQSEEEAKSATLGTPLTVYLVYLDDLQNFENESTSNDLLQDSKIVMYPVMVDDTIRSAVGIQNSEDGWTPATFGNATLIKAIAEIGLNKDSFIVQVSALGLYFVGEQNEDGLFLTSITETGYDLPVGRPIKAEQVFSILQEAALDIDPDSPM